MVYFARLLCLAPQPLLNCYYCCSAALAGNAAAVLLLLLLER
jgi:hypothetical protein